LFQFVLGSGKNYDDFVFVENVAHSHICAEKTLSSEEGAKIAGGQVSHRRYIACIWYHVYTFLTYLATLHFADLFHNKYGTSKYVGFCISGSGTSRI